MPSKSLEIREEIRSIIEHLSDPSPQMRRSAAKQLGDFSEFMLPCERPLAMLQLKTLIITGTEQSDFLFGLHALGRVASGDMPSHINKDIPFTKKDAVGIVFEVCSLDWVSEKLDQGIIVKAGVKAITAIAEASPEQVQCKLLEMLSRKSETSRMLALTSIFVLDLKTSEAIQKVAFSTLEAHFDVRVRAEETFRKISRFGHPIRNIILCNTPREARNAAELLLNQEGQDIKPLKALAVISFLRGTEKGNELINLMLERNLLKETDIKNHEKEAREGCSNSEMETRLGRRRRQLHSKLFAMQMGQGMSLGRDSALPSRLGLPGFRNSSRPPPQLHKRRTSSHPRSRASEGPAGKILN